jgi:methionyl-tRNA formyltransferase
LSPFPGAWCEIKGERVKILFADPVEGKGAPGEALNDALTIACGDGALRLRSLQRPGKSAMTADDLLRGYAVPKGTKLS